MADGREAVAAVVVAVTCLWAAAAAAWHEEERLRDRPCPNAEDIHPCVCSVEMDFLMTMNCSDVQSSYELASIFSNDLPFLDFTRLIIENNQHIADLRVGDLGNATFQEISITFGVLQTVAGGALANSHRTLTTLVLSRNHISQFPFDELTDFTRLNHIHMAHNSIKDFPHISSPTLRDLSLSFNPLMMMDSAALQDLPNLETVALTSCGLSQVEPGTFVGLKQLNYISLMDNDLTILWENTIEFSQETFSFNAIELQGNQLTTVEPNAITVVATPPNSNHIIVVDGNRLKELKEGVWRPLMDENFSVAANSNPLTCGCEIAWIILNPDYLNLLYDDPACADGVLVSDLDSAVFEAICT